MREFRHIPDGTYAKQSAPKIVNRGDFAIVQIGHRRIDIKETHHKDTLSRMPEGEKNDN